MLGMTASTNVEDVLLALVKNTSKYVSGSLRIVPQELVVNFLGLISRKKKLLWIKFFSIGI